MKIAVNLFLTSPKSVTGAFVYIQQILPALFKADEKNTYYLFGESESVDYFRLLYGHLPNVKYRVFGIKHDLVANPIRAIKKIVAKIRRDYRTRESIIAEEIRDVIRKETIDVYFSPASTVFPRGLDAVKKVTAIMDLQHEYFPENFSSAYLAKRRVDFAYAVEHSDRLIAISEYTKKSLVDKCAAAPDKITVIYFAPQEIKKGPTDFDFPKEFIFYPAALWPHKNHRVLIRALGILKDRFPSLHVVCAGTVKGGGFKKELELLAESEGLQGRVSFSGFLFGGNLYALFTKAKALVFPSAFEGFGIPLVEAFQLGLPVIAADNSSITEVVDGAGLLIKTGDAQDLASAIEKVLTDDHLRGELIRKGHERAKLFSWEKAAKETLAVFTQAALDTE
ncbi:MAG: glycosyltransferase family 4 protein [Patescibacteria group bacterium]|nr:glycosyltransferase family 4 protein [Patescibacteria group bacterium]